MMNNRIDSQEVLNDIIELTKIGRLAAPPTEDIDARLAAVDDRSSHDCGAIAMYDESECHSPLGRESSVLTMSDFAEDDTSAALREMTGALIAEEQLCAPVTGDIDVELENLRAERTSAAEPDGAYRRVSRVTIPRADEARIDEAIGRFRRELAAEAKAEVMRTLKDYVGLFVEQVRASCAWLFLYRNTTQELVGTILHNSWKPLTLRVDSDRAIVTHVAASKHGCVVDDVHAFEDYRHEVSGVRSALSVPILTAKKELLGILHFESFTEAAFSQAQLVEMEVAATRLIPYLLLWRRQDAHDGQRNIWLPIRYGWNMELVLRNCLHAVTEAVADGAVSGPSFTLWHADWEKEKMWVLATTGFQHEYLRNNTMPIDSFVGRVAAGPRQRIWRFPDDDACLVSREKADRMGVKRIIGVPIYGAGDSDRSYGALNVCYLDDRPSTQLLSQAFLVRMAETLGTMITDYQEQKREMSVAYVQQKLLRSRSPLVTMLKGLLHCLEADECSIFAHEKQADTLVGIVSTGLGDAGVCNQASLTNQAIRCGRLTYHMDEEKDQGFTVYLGRHPGACVRKNDIPDPAEKGLPPLFPRNPSNKCREICATSDTDHRRILGISVNQNDDVLGVIRVLRSPESKPFRTVDVDLLHALSQLSVPLLLDSRTSLQGCGRLENISDNCSGKLSQPIKRPLIVSAVNALMEPLRNTGSGPKRQINTLLQSIVTVVRQDMLARGGGGNEFELLACFHELHRHKLPMALHLYEYHSSKQRELAHGPMQLALPTCKENLAYQAMVKRRIISTDNAGERDLFGSPIYGDGSVVSQAVVPVIAWAGNDVVEGLLSLSSQRPIEWDTEYIRLLQLASHRLAAILSSTEEIVSPGAFDGTLSDALPQLAEHVVEKLGARWARLYFKNVAGGRPLGTVGRYVAIPRQSWRRVEEWQQKQVQAEAIWKPRLEGVGAYGVAIARHDRACRIPLFLGPIEVGRLEWGPVSPWFHKEWARSIGEVCNMWLQLSQKQGLGRRLGFRKHHTRGAITTWCAQSLQGEFLTPRSRQRSSVSLFENCDRI